MMSDLMASLNRRRKGISGDKSGAAGGSSGSGGAMDKVSSMIPPPKPRANTNNTSEGSAGEWSD